MKLIELIFALAIFLAIASILVPVIFSLIGMLLPFIGKRPAASSHKRSKIESC